MMKKKSGKRFLSWLLAAVMIIALMPANAFANDDNDYGGIDTYANQSNDNVEFWCTNSRVNVGGKTSASLNSLLSGKTQLVFAQESSLQEGTLTNGSGLTGKLWKVMVQDNRNKQTGNSNDNKTGTGTEITSIWGEWKWIHFQGYRYQYNYLTADGKTGTLRSNQTVVVYYKQVFVTDSNYGIIYGTDWGYNDGSHDDAPTRITYQFAQENNNGTPTILKSGDYWYAKKTDPIKGIGAQLNPKYEISKITVDDTECTNGEEISLDRQSSHVVTFYIRSVETTKVQYNWIGAENLGDDVKLPTDTGDYNWGDTATLTEEAAAFTPNLIKKGTDGVKYMFSGWYDNHEFKGSPVTSITVSDTNYTFYGRWTSAAVEVDLNKDDSNTNRFEKTLTNAEKLSDNAEREFTISITNDDDSNETYTGTATVSKENPTAPFEFDETQKMVFDIDDAGIGEDGTVPENGVDYTYTVKEETSGSSDDIEFDNATYKMKVNLKLEDGNLVATVSFTDATEGAVTTPITFTNTYTPAYPVYVYGRYMHNNDHLKGDVTVNNEKVQWNADSTNQNAKEYYITFGKIEKGTKVEATEGATTSDLLFSTDSITLNEEFSGTGSAASNNVSLSNVNSWGNVHACPGAVGYTNEGFAWHMDGNINVYTVAYDDGVDDASVTNMPTNPQGYFFGSYTTAAAPSREGYDFQGWKAEGTDNVYEANQEFTLNGDVTLVAQWTLSNANVTFMIDGGTWTAPEAVKDTANAFKETIKLDNGHATLANIGYTPKGKADDSHTGNGKWYKDSNPIIGDFENQSVENGAIFILKFEPKAPPKTATVTFEIDGGTWNSTAPESIVLDVENGPAKLSDKLSAAPKGTANENYSPEGKWYKKVNDDLVSVDNILNVNIDSDTTFVLKFDKQQYTIEYQWSTDRPSDITETQLPPATTKDGLAPTEETEINALNKAAEKTYTTTSTTNKDGKYGEWTLVGWTPLRSDDGTKIIFTGNWKFTEKEKPVEVKVTFKIKGGTWDGTNSEDQTTTVILTNGAGYLKEEQLPKGTHTPDANHIGTGYWKIDKGQDITSILIQGNTDFIYTFNERGTVATELSKLIQKEFKSQYNYSTEGTFTAIAEVIAEPVAIAISYTAEEMDEPTEARIYDGTVTLKTGETKAFDFSAKDKMADVLTPNTRYTVRVSEDKGDLSKVTYDTTKYILGFETDGNAVVDYIWIAKEKDSENDHPELEPVEGTTITFHNIYTYKRHHSSSDGGNGGGKKEEKPTVEIKDDDALGLNNTDHFAYIVGYGNGEVRPQNSITRAEVAAIFFRLLEDDVRDANYTRQNKFTDVSNDAWYCSAVSTLSAMGIISGYPDATFRPNASITRAEFAAIATRFDVNGDKTPASFNDIAGHWAKDEIAVAANNGWVNGYEDGSFRPQNKITRAETMSLVNRVLNRKPETAEDLLENMTKWTDNADTNAWYYLAVQEATNSHYYKYKENSQYEKWTELRETRDWSELDK